MFNPLMRLMPKKDYPNNFDKFRKIPAERFKQIEFEEFMDWKVAGVQQSRKREKISIDLDLAKLFFYL